MTLKEIIRAFEERMGGYLSAEEIKKAILEFEAIETENPDLVLEESSMLSLPEAFSEIYILFLKMKALAKANEQAHYANASLEFLSLYQDYKRGKMRRSAVLRQDVKYY